MPLLSRSSKRPDRTDENYTVCSCHCHFTNVQTHHVSMSTAKPSKRKRTKELYGSDQTTHSVVQHDGIASRGFDNNFNATASLTPLETELTSGGCMRGNLNTDNVLNYHLGAEMGYLLPSSSCSELSAARKYFPAITPTAVNAVEKEDNLSWLNYPYDSIDELFVGYEANSDALQQNLEPNVSTSFASHEPPTLWFGNPFTSEFRTDEPSFPAFEFSLPPRHELGAAMGVPQVSSELSHSLSEEPCNDLMLGRSFLAFNDNLSARVPASEPISSSHSILFDTANKDMSFSSQWGSGLRTECGGLTTSANSIAGGNELFELFPPQSAKPNSSNDNHNKFNSGANTKDKETRRESQSKIGARFGNLEGGTKHSPVLIVNEDSNETHQEVLEALAKVNQTYARANSGDLSPKRKAFAEPDQVKWEHIFVLSDSFQRAGNREPKQRTSQKIGRRCGPLPPMLKERASQVRKVRACWHCWNFKVPCSPGDVCHRCQDSLLSPLTGRLCSRVRFREFTDLFLPLPAVGQFHKSALDSLISEKVTGFTNNKIEIEISSGPTYPLIRLAVHEFFPKDHTFLALPQLVTDETSNESRIIASYAPPLGLNEPANINATKLKCLEHINLMIKSERNVGEVEYGETSQISWRVLKAVSQYQRASPGNALLRKAMMLYATEYFMTRSLLFTDDSAQRAMRNLKRPMQVPYSPDVSSRLITRQVKHEMYKLLHEITAEVLEGLEKELRSRTRSSWATSFCIILVLSMYAEMVQVVTDVRLVRQILEGTSVSRDISIETCRILDDLPIAQCSDIFHAVYRTSKPIQGPRNERGFNPIRDGLEVDAEEGINQDMADLVKQICDIVREHKDELPDLVRQPSLDNEPDLLSNHMKFREKNSGRLVAKFLQSMQ